MRSCFDHVIFTSRTILVDLTIHVAYDSLHILRFAKIIGAKRPGKCASTSHKSISVMDKE